MKFVTTLCVAAAMSVCMSAFAAPEAVVLYDWSASPIKKSEGGFNPAFAYAHTVDFDSRRDGEWSESDGTRHWELTIRVPGAASVAAELTYEPVDGSVLEVAGEYLINAESRYVSCHTGKEAITLEVTVPATGGDPLVKITGLRLSEQNVTAKASSANEWVNYSCYHTSKNDVNGRATVGVTFDGAGFCTATLINNRMGPSGAPKPMILTAAHCRMDGDPNQLVKNMRLYWKAESPCGASDPGDFSVLNNPKGPVQVVSGRHVVSIQNCASGDPECLRGDFWLIELDRWPVAEANAWAAGFDARDQSPAPGVLYDIHHGTAKDKQYLESSVWTYDDRRPRGHGYYTAVLMDPSASNAVGVVAPGASGSGLFIGGSDLFVGLTSGGGTESSLHPLIGGPWTESNLGTYLVPNPSDPTSRVLSGREAPVAITPQLTFSADRANAKQYENVNLTWAAQYVSSCVASQGWSGQKTTSGSESASLNATGTYRFVLSCTGDNGSVSREVSIVVTGATPTPTPTPVPTPTPTAQADQSGGGSFGFSSLLILAAVARYRFGVRRSTK